MDFDDINIDLKDPEFQDKVATKLRQDILNGYIGGLICAFFESVVSGWLRRVLCGIFLVLAYYGGLVGQQHPIFDPLVGFAVASLVPLPIPLTSIFVNVSGRVLGVILLQLIQMMRARVADRVSALVGTILFQLEPIVALAVMLTFRLSFLLGIIVCVVLPAVSLLVVPFTQIFLAVVTRLPYPVRWLIVLPIRIYDTCNRWLQYQMIPGFYRAVDRVEHDRLQTASSLLSQRPVYQYASLTNKRHFRVLVLERRRLFQPPVCRLEVDTFDRGSAHIACSYVWGDATQVRSIAIGHCRLDITESAYNVIRHQQSFLAERRIWIDAICINQVDLEEKAVQIEHMGEIYGHALHVDAYLKFGQEDSDLWVLIYDLLNKNVMQQAFNQTDHHLIHQEHLKPYWNRLFDLLGSQWFNRMWVMQEIMLAGDLYLHHGRVRMGWPQLRGIVESMDTAVLRGTFRGQFHLNRRYASTENIFTPAHLVTTRGILKKHQESLYTLLRFFRQQQASDPRDKIYGLLSLAPPDVRVFLGPAYQITLDELLIRTMRYVVLKEGLICLLSCHRGSSNSLANGLPSWVIDWCTEGQSIGQHDIPTWKAATRIQALPYDIQSCPITSRTLPVRVMPAIDTVGETVSGPQSRDPITVDDLDEFVAAFQAWLTRGRDIVLRSSTHTDPETVERLKRSFYRTITYDHEDADNEETLQWSHPNFQSDIEFLEDWYNVGGDFAESRQKRLQRRLERMMQPLADETGKSIHQLRQEVIKGNIQMLKDLKEVPDEEDGGDHKLKAAASSAAAQEDLFMDTERVMKIQERLFFSIGRRTGVTLSGRVGSFPKDAQEGDEICLIAGAPAPFVVRKVTAESNSSSDDHDGGDENGAQGYQLVGWCYLHGGMDGSLATGPWTNTYLV